MGASGAAPLDTTYDQDQLESLIDLIAEQGRVFSFIGSHGEQHLR